MEILKCSTCGLSKFENVFSRDRYKRKGANSRQALFGRTYDCLACIRLKRKAAHEKNPEIARRRNAKKRAIYQTPEFKKKHRRHHYMKRYGITPEIYDEMLNQQKGVCAICGNGKKHKRQKYLHVDHNHKTGKVRGLLCIRCNTILGNSKDDVNILENAIKYLGNT